MKYSELELEKQLRERLREEYDAINQYEKMLPFVNEEVAKVISDIASEEKVHVGELEKLLYSLSPVDEKKAKEGMKEASGIMDKAIRKIDGI